MSFLIGSTQITVSFWFVAVITLLLILFPTSQAGWVFVFCVIHELGHLSAMLACGKKAKKIELGYFGIKIVTDKRFLPPLREALIASGGPCINLFVSSILFIIGKENLAVINLSLALFNLIPVSTLDGGHILSALFPDSKILKKLSLAVIILLLLLGIIVAVYSEKNFTVLIVSLYLLTGIFCDKK